MIGSALLRKSSATAIVTLAFWQLRQVWRFFLLVAVGMITAVVLVSSLPLFSLVNTTAGVRSALNNGLFDSTSYVQANTSLVSSSQIKRATQQVTQQYQQLAGSAFTAPIFSIVTAESGIVQNNRLARDQVLKLHGYDITHIASHLQLIQGRLPDKVDQSTIVGGYMGGYMPLNMGGDQPRPYEIALSESNALALHVNIGSELTAYTQPTDGSKPLPIPLQVVGIFHDVSFYDPFWHGDPLISFYDATTRLTHDSAIVNNSALLALFDQLASHNKGQAVSFSTTLFWYFPLDKTVVNSTNIDTVDKQLAILARQVPHIVEHLPYVNSITVTNTDLLTLIHAAHDQTATSQVPVILLFAIVLGLILFFTSLMTELLVIRQAETIAMTHARGASLGQIFLTFLFQGLMLGILTLLVSPWLTVLTVHLLIRLLLPVADQGALNVLPATPWAIFSYLSGYLFAAVGIAILTMSISIWRTLNSSTLGRSTVPAQSPLWQRFSLDLLLIVLGACTYGLSAYLATTGIITDQLQVLLAGPCIVIASILLSLAAVLLYLRCFPWLLRFGARIAARGRGITPLLSLEMMSRTPRQAIRMSLLLILTIAFAIFSLVFTSTQTQRIADLADYRSGADFSGAIEQTNPSIAGTIQQQQEQYAQIPGVLSAAVGFEYPYNFLHTPGFIQLVAVDPHSFASSVIWSQENPQQSSLERNALIAHLADKRAAFTSTLPNTALPPLPAIVDTTTSTHLRLSPGQTFSLTSTGSTLKLIDIGAIQHIPGIDDALVQGNSNKQGVLVDYESFVPAYERLINNPNDNLTPNAVWLHARQDATSQATIRRTLTQSSLALESLADHQALLQQLEHDPLYLNILCALLLGVSLSLLLAFFGMVTSVWLAVKNRLRSLAVLRALGTSPGQLISLLAWEQGILYVTTMILGLLAGFFFTLLTLSSLIFSGTAQTGSLSNSYTSAIYFLQFTPPLQIILPSSLFLVLGIIVGLGIITLAITIYTASRPSLAHILRLSEDYVEEVPIFIKRTSIATIKVSPPISGKQENEDEKSGWLAVLSRIPGTWGRLPLRRSWGLQLLVILGVLIAIMFIGVIPLFAQVAETVGLRDVLSHTASQYASVQINSSINSSIEPIALENLPQVLTTNTRALNHTLLDQSQPFFHNPAIVTIQANILPEDTNGGPPIYDKASPIEFFGLSEANLPAHISILQGHLPQRADRLQIALTPGTAAYLHVKVGDILPSGNGHPFTMQVTGLFQPKTQPDTLLPSSYLLFTKQAGEVIALVSSEGFTQASTMLTQSQPQQHPWFLGSIHWYYQINSQQPTIDQLDSMITTFSTLEQNGPISQNTLPLDELAQYQKSIRIANVPIVTISLLTIGLILLFLNLISELLVEQEIDTIAILRSRGASQLQIFSTFFTHLLLLAITGVGIGLALVIPVTLQLSQMTFLPVDHEAITLITTQPIQKLLGVSVYVLACLFVTLATLGLAVYRASRMNIITFRQEVSRSTQQPLWQRFYLDVVGVLLAFGAYAFSLYLTNADVFSPEVNIQVKSPLVVIATVCLVVTCMLVFLRMFPWLLRVGTVLAMRNRGVEPMLAISQMARTPRQNLRVGFLLISTTAFVVFISVFTASQNQHIRDVAQYWTGADFSGPLINQVDNSHLASLQKAYSQLPGVLSASTGYVTQESNSSNESTKVLAVDPSSFLRTINWPEVQTVQQQNAMIQLLTSRRDQLRLYSIGLTGPDMLSQLTIPAIVDAHTWDMLQLSPGQVFQLQNSLNYIAVARVNTIPSGNEDGQNATSAIQSQNSTILVDYQSFATAYRYTAQVFQQVLHVPADPDATVLKDNYVWLNARSDPKTLSGIRRALDAGLLQLASVADRQAIIQNLEYDPLNLELSGSLILGTLAPLALTWLGCLVASWIQAGQRALLFGILQALGGTRKQLKSVLIWEQAIVYGAAILLGSLLGLLMTLLALPSLVLTSKLPDNSLLDLFSLQNTPPVHIVLPASLGLVIGLVVGMGLVSVLLMNRVISWVALAQRLRLNED